MHVFFQHTSLKKLLNAKGRRKLKFPDLTPALFLAAIAVFVIGFLSINGCTSSSNISYNATIADGRAAAVDIMNKTSASSISIALVDGDRVVWAETFGYADKKSKTAPTVDTMYSICSVSKMVVTIAVMKLVDQKLVSHTPRTWTRCLRRFDVRGRYA